LAMYDKVVCAVDSKLNPLSLARIASAVATALAVTDMTAATAVLENLLSTDKKEELGVTAVIYVQSKLSLLQLQLLASAESEKKEEQLNSIKQVIKSNAAVLQEMMVDTTNNADEAVVHAAHYEQAMVYYKVVGPPEAFYEQALQFLNYAPPPSLDKKAKDSAVAASSNNTNATVNYYQLAVDLVLAALTGDGVYNLGQVEQTAVLTVLEGTPNQWLMKLLMTVASGRVDEFQTLTKTHAADIAQQPALVNRSAAVQEKLTLLALVHLIFEKGAHERCLPFDEIATRLQIPVTQVEWVVMRALSVQLMEGFMDQVDQTFTVTSVMPRVLNQQQTLELASKFGEWAVKVSNMKDYMEEQTITAFA